MSAPAAVFAKQTEEGEDAQKRSLRALYRGRPPQRRCINPQRVVAKLFQCVAAQDVDCIVAQYSDSVERKHNEVVLPEFALSDPAFWNFAFLFFPTFAFDIKFVRNFDKNQATIRYIETVVSTDGASVGLEPSTTFPFAQAVDQHEHSIYTVDGDCKIISIDQYGDNQEQDEVGVILLAIQCILDPSMEGGCDG